MTLSPAMDPDLDVPIFGHLEPIPNSYAFLIGTLTFVFFKLVTMVLRHSRFPTLVRKKEEIWKCENLFISWIHSFIVGCWVLICLYTFPEMRQDLLSFHNLPTYAVVAFSTGYFMHDFSDIIINQKSSEMWEVQIHHLAVFSIFFYNIIYCTNIGYTVVALMVEVHSIFMHARKLMQMCGIAFEHPAYRASTVLNIIAFVVFRFSALYWITYGIVVYRRRMSAVFVVLILSCMFIMWVINFVLFWRLLRSDFLRNMRRGASSRTKRSPAAEDQLPGAMKISTHSSTSQEADVNSNFATNGVDRSRLKRS